MWILRHWHSSVHGPVGGIWPLVRDFSKSLEFRKSFWCFYFCSGHKLNCRKDQVLSFWLGIGNRFFCLLLWSRLAWPVQCVTCILGYTKLDQQLSSWAGTKHHTGKCWKHVWDHCNYRRGLFVLTQDIGGERKGESRKQSSRAAVQALTALLCAEIDYLHFLQVKGRF